MSETNRLNEFIARGEILSRAASAPEFDRFFPLGGEQFAYSVKGLASDKGEMSASGLLSYEEPDRVRELLVLDGLDLTGFERNPIGLFQHNKSAPVGLFRNPKTKQFTVRRSGKRLECCLHFAQTGPAAPMAEQVFGLADSGVLNGFSLGFLQNWKSVSRTPDDANDPYGGGVIRIGQSKAFEGSLVFIPENDKTLVTEVVRKGLRSASGSGFKPLLPEIASALSPYAEPDSEWVTSGWEDRSKQMAPLPTETTTQPVVPQSYLQAADRAAWYDRAVNGRVGLPLDEYQGKPGAKALRAMHDAAMFNALQAVVTLEEIDGPAEKSLREFVSIQTSIAESLAVNYKQLYGDDPDWAFPDASEVNGQLADPTPDGKHKAEIDRVKRWAARAKGWRKGHAERAAAAAKVLRDLTGISAPPTDDQRKSAALAAASLESMVSEKGLLVEVDDARDRQIAEMTATVSRLESEFARVQKELKRARSGSY